jgi:hypothetical protein
MATAVQVSRVMHMQDLGVERRDGADRIVLRFVRYAEAMVGRWVQFPRGVLLFLMVPGDSESGCFYILDRACGTFYMIEIEEDGRWGGYRLDEFEDLARLHGLLQLAQWPQRLRATQ